MSFYPPLSRNDLDALQQGVYPLALKQFTRSRMQHCNVTAHKHGKDRQGFQRWKCPVCGQTFSDNPTPQKAGRKPIGAQAMTAAERKRKQRAKKKDETP